MAAMRLASLFSLVLLVGASVAHAAEEARVAPENTLLIGDSQAEGLRPVLGKKGVKAYARIGKLADYFVQRLATQKALREQVGFAQLVYLQLGGNHVTRGDRPTEIRHALCTLVDDIRALNPSVRVVLGEIPIRGAWFDRVSPTGDRREEALETINAWIRGGGDARCAFEPFSSNDVVSDPNDPRQQRAEFRRKIADVHLNSKGYAALGESFSRRYF
jgi:lysophospholipase L1-like esterase